MFEDTNKLRDRHPSRKYWFAALSHPNAIPATMVVIAMLVVFFTVDFFIFAGLRHPAVYILPLFLVFWHRRASVHWLTAILCLFAVLVHTLLLWSVVAPMAWVMAVLMVAVAAALLHYWLIHSTSTSELRNFTAASRVEQGQPDLHAPATDRARLLSVIAHDLRTPANALTLLSDLLQATAAKSQPAELVEIAAAIKANTRLLVTFLENVIDLFRFDQQRFDLRPETIDLAELIQRELDRHTPDAAQAGISLRCEPGEAIQLYTDSRRLLRLFGILLDNAIRYSPRGTVSVGWGQVQDQLRIEVRDNGIGIPAQETEVLFNPLYQLNRPGRDPSRGTGISLAVAKLIADGMGIRITVDSQPNVGSCFTLVLPKSMLLVVGQSETADSR